MPDGKMTSKQLRFVAVGQSLIKRDLQGESAQEFQDISKLVRSADVALTNYEGTILGRYGGWSMQDSFTHASDPIVLDTLKAIGFNALSLSNNHAFDLGSPGILSTLEEVRKREFMHAGIGINKTQAAQPGYMQTEKGMAALVAMDCGPLPECFYAHDANDYTTERPGINRQRVIESLQLEPIDFERMMAISHWTGNEERKAEYQRVGFRPELANIQEFYGIRLACGEITEERYELDPDDLNRNVSAIREASGKADFVIVYVHHHYWNPTWQEAPAWIQDFARQCIDAGGHVFVSHGVPLLQGIEVYRRRPIFYSLGNFIFHSFRKSTYARDSLWQSVIASCEFDRQGNLISAEFDPISLGGHQAIMDQSLSRDVPYLVTSEYGDEILCQFADLSSQFHTHIHIEHGRGKLILD